MSLPQGIFQLCLDCRLSSRISKEPLLFFFLFLGGSPYVIFNIQYYLKKDKAPIKISLLAFCINCAEYYNQIHIESEESLSNL
jgi:hypothetical protein